MAAKVNDEFWGGATAKAQQLVTQIEKLKEGVGCEIACKEGGDVAVDIALRVALDTTVLGPVDDANASAIILGIVWLAEAMTVRLTGEK